MAVKRGLARLSATGGHGDLARWLARLSAPSRRIEPGMSILLAAGERGAVDAR